MATRVDDELGLLQGAYPGAGHVEKDGNHWFLLPQYRFPPGWRLHDKEVEAASISFMINAGYPGQQPYAFMVPAGMTFGGVAPTNSTAVPEGQNPFPGKWLQLSWTPDFPWQADSDVLAGSNLLHWARSFAARLREGV